MSTLCLAFAFRQFKPGGSCVRAASFGLIGTSTNPDPTESMGAWRSRMKKSKDKRANRDTDERYSRSKKVSQAPPATDERRPRAFLRRESMQDRRDPTPDSREHGMERRRYAANMTPTRTLYVGGIGRANTDGDTDKVRKVFKSYAKIEDVRMSTMSCHIDARTIEEAVKLIMEHNRNPFRYGDHRLRMNFVEPDEDDPGAAKTLFISGFAGGEQRVRDLLKDWDNAISNVTGGKNGEIDVAWVAFHDRNAAAEAMQTLWVLHPDLSVDWARSDSAEDQVPIGEPSSTLCIIGFKGNKYDLRRHLGNFRQAVRDVRIPEKHEKAGRWDFVFVMFKTRERATEALEVLANSPHFRVRYMKPDDKDMGELL